MAESGEPPFSKEKRGFFISTSVVNQKAVHPKGGPSSLNQSFLFKEMTPWPQKL